LKIQKPSSFDDAEEIESETIQRILNVLNLTEGHRVTEAVVSLSAATDCNEERAAAAGQRFMRTLPFLL
jgi:hypothetical protein